MAYTSVFPFELSDWQKRAVQSTEDGNHCLVTAPTGSGKTVPAEYAIHYFTGQGKKVIYTSPIKALSNQKYTNLTIIKTSKAPFLRVDDKENKMTFDISFNNFDGFFQFKEVNKAFKIYPELRYLIFVMKVFLKQRDQSASNQGNFLLR